MPAPQQNPGKADSELLPTSFLTCRWRSDVFAAESSNAEGFRVFRRHNAPTYPLLERLEARRLTAIFSCALEAPRWRHQAKPR